MATTIKTTFKLRRGLSSDWERVNPTLEEGEPGFAIDLNKIKIGIKNSNGELLRWNDLPYLSESDISISPDGKSLAHNQNGQLSVYGFEGAEINQVPIKDEAGNLIWTTLAPVAFTGLIEDLQQKEIFILNCGGAPAPQEEEN
jgi:hypothetical protein